MQQRTEQEKVGISPNWKKPSEKKSTELKTVLGFCFSVVVTASALWLACYDGVYSYEYFTAYKHESLTQVATDFARQQEASADGGYTISSIQYELRFIEHDGEVTYTRDGKEHTLVYRENDLPGLFSAWIDLKQPESIRVHLKHDKPVDKKTAHAKKIKASILAANEAVQKHIADKDRWKTVFNFQ